uniref:Secreted protein n=1 Tax=Ixodes ricinus TaxID=34613 RepID=A0A147BLN4_IXORI
MWMTAVALELGVLKPAWQERATCSGDASNVPTTDGHWKAPVYGKSGAFSSLFIQKTLPNPPLTSSMRRRRPLDVPKRLNVSVSSSGAMPVVWTFLVI